MHSLVLFDPEIGPYQVLPLRVSGSDGNEGVLRTPQSSSITGTSQSDCLVSYPGYSLVGVLPLFRDEAGVFYSLTRLSKTWVILLLYRQFFVTHRYDPNMYYHSRSERTCELWPWSGIPYFPAQSSKTEAMTQIVLSYTGHSLCRSITP